MNKAGVSAAIQTAAGTICMGDYFEAKTVKGGMNIIVFFFEKDGMVYYCHGDKGKKVPKGQFLSALDHGDIRPIPREKVDPERVALSVLGLQAMANGLAFNDYINVMFNNGKPSEA